MTEDKGRKQLEIGGGDPSLAIGLVVVLFIWVLVLVLHG